MPLYGVKSVFDIKKDCAKIKTIIDRCLASGDRLITSDYKTLIEAFGITPYKTKANVYDFLLPDMQVSDNETLTRRVLEKMRGMEAMEWHRIIANASVVYSSLEERGIEFFGHIVYPRWSMKTYSGRSKTIGHNIQGSTTGDKIYNPNGFHDDVLIHFDWCAADIRVAAFLSGDELLSEACEHIDPYAYIADHLDPTGNFSRNEAKAALLTSINSMDTSAHIMDALPRLRQWIINCSEVINAGGHLSSMLGRKFRKRNDKKSDWSPFNAQMQGSIAHAMHIVVREIWEEFDDKLLADVHDSIVMACPRDIATIKQTINRVQEIMCWPFKGYIDSNPVFPVKVSIGDKWKEWKEYSTYPKSV